ncbi:MAG TPA: hypothetical protein DCX06_14145 [Opitutae bacterium]|nr:hypothetical protein [Opitutae bacterium]
MPFSRRRFILGSFSLSCWTLASRLRGSTVPSNRSALESTLRAWVNTLLPADRSSPAAGDVGVHFEIIKKAESNRQYMQLLEIGVRWIENEATQLGITSFTQLDPAQAEFIVAKAEASGLQAMPGLFFYHTLRDAKAFYYSKEASWAGVGFPHQPQPLGYMDYAEAPKG